MTDLDPADTLQAAPDTQDDTGWRRLPPQARTLFTLSAAITSAAIVVAQLIAIGVFMPDGALKIIAAVAAMVLVPALLVWLARKKYQYTAWRLDAEGFALRRGKFWSVETRVPTSRVQHLDLVRGPLERRFGLATLVMHTAGTRQSAVSVGGMDADDAEHLRDVLTRGMEDDDDA